jgi:hypothetical protein
MWDVRASNPMRVPGDEHRGEHAFNKKANNASSVFLDFFVKNFLSARFAVSKETQRSAGDSTLRPAHIVSATKGVASGVNDAQLEL